MYEQELVYLKPVMPSRGRGTRLSESIRPVRRIRRHGDARETTPRQQVEFRGLLRQSPRCVASFSSEICTILMLFLIKNNSSWENHGRMGRTLSCAQLSIFSVCNVNVIICV